MCLRNTIAPPGCSEKFRSICLQELQNVDEWCIHCAHFSGKRGTELTIERRIVMYEPHMNREERMIEWDVMDRNAEVWGLLPPSTDADNQEAGPSTTPKSILRKDTASTCSLGSDTSSTSERSSVRFEEFVRFRYIENRIDIPRDQFYRRYYTVQERDHMLEYYGRELSYESHDWQNAPEEEEFTEVHGHLLHPAHTPYIIPKRYPGRVELTKRSASDLLQELDGLLIPGRSQLL